MKSYIINSIVFAMFLFSNITVCVAKEIYKNVDQDVANRTTTVSLYEGEAEKNLLPFKKYVISYIEDNIPSEKIVYKWDVQKSEWFLSGRYEYLYDDNGTPLRFSHSEWDAKTKEWNVELQYPIYLFDLDKDLLTINMH